MEAGAARGAMGALAQSPDGKFIFSGGLDSTVKQWDASSGEVSALTRAAACVTCGAISHRALR